MIIIPTTICPSTGCAHLFAPSKPWPKWWVQSPKAQRLRCCIESVGCSGSGRTRGLTVVNFWGVVSLHKKRWLHGHLHRNSCQEAIHQNEQTPRHQSAPASGIDHRWSVHQRFFYVWINSGLRTALLEFIKTSTRNSVISCHFKTAIVIPTTLGCQGTQLVARSSSFAWAVEATLPCWRLGERRSLGTNEKTPIRS